MGNSPRDCGPGGQWLGFILSGGELSSWGVVREPFQKYVYQQFPLMVFSLADMPSSFVQQPRICSVNDIGFNTLLGAGQTITLSQELQVYGICCAFPKRFNLH